MNLFQKMAVATTLLGTFALGETTTLAGTISTGGEKQFTPEAMMQLYRISGASLSPNGATFLYSRSLPNVELNKMEREIMVGDVNHPGSAKVLIAKGKGHSPVFLNNKQIAYISTEQTPNQLAVINIDGTEQRVISSYDFNVEAFLFSPKRNKVVVIRHIPLPNITKNENPDLDKTTGVIIDDLMYKHWDEWNTYAPQPFISEVGKDLKVAPKVIPVLGEDEPYEVPTKPFSGMEDLSWSPDESQLVYSCRKKSGLDYAVSTNTDIYLFDLTNGKTTNLTEGMMGYDTAPQFSHNGKYIAWISMERDGYEADLQRLFILDLESGKKSFLSKEYDNYVHSFQWIKGDRSIRFQSNDYGLGTLFEIDLKGKVKRVYKPDMADLTSFSGDDKVVLFTQQSMKDPADLYLLKEGKVTKLTTDNDAFLSQFSNVTIQERWIPTTTGEKMLVWVVLPPHFDATKKYPAVLYCQGGPQSTVSQFWSYRWNIRTFASEGYIMVCPNRHGVPGFGHKWNEQISGDYGGQNMKDYFTAIDTVSKEPYVDKDRLGATGASYGGFSVYWLAGHHEGRFKALMAHAGIFNLQAQYLETEEKWFANWDMGGAYWDKENKVAQQTFANSPHLFVDKWTAPILISVGDYDFRILSSQGMQAFDAAKMRGIPARLLYFPDESHWIIKPQNGILFYRTWFDWMGRYLK